MVWMPKRSCLRGVPFCPRGSLRGTLADGHGDLHHHAALDLAAIEPAAAALEASGQDARSRGVLVLTPDQLADFRGIVGHHHVSSHKVDPGPAFDWERLVRGANSRQ